MFFLYIDPGTGFTIVSVGGLMFAFLAGFLGVFAIFFRKIFGFIKKYKKIAATLVLVAVIIGMIIKGVLIMAEKKAAFNNKVVILGFDGLSPEIIEPMMERGELPNFSRLKEQGSYAHLSTTNPSQSPVAWSGFATGRNPGKNGVYDFIIRDPKTYELNLSLSNIQRGRALRVIKGKCFWNYTSERNIPTTIITCPVTFPPDKIHGKMLSGMGVPDILGTEGTFTFYTSEKPGNTKDTGGKVFSVKRSPLMIMNLIGPKIAAAGRKAENIKVPFRATILQKDNNSVEIAFQDNKFTLSRNEWSDWKEVTFKLGFLRKMKGICKFHLVETEPEFKLYISPINYDPRDPYFPISHPPNYSRELVKQTGLYYTMGMPMDTWAMNEKRLTEEPFLEQANMVLDEKNRMLDLEFGRMSNGVLFCYFESSDIIQHMFWRYTDPEHPLYEANAPREYRDVIKSWYRKLDDTLGRVMRGLDEKDTLLVLSDHGFGTFRRAAHVNTWLRKNGYLTLDNPGAERGGELLENIDWSGTKAYAIGFGAIYINQEGRERNGIVKPGRETEALKNEISKKLTTWQDDKYNSPVISRVYEREEMFWGEYADNTPDLYIGFNIGYRASWQTALGAVPKELIEDNLKKWSGSHLFDPALVPGVLFSNKRISKEAPTIYDIAPTIMKITGFDGEELKECDLDGAPLF